MSEDTRRYVNAAIYAAAAVVAVIGTAGQPHSVLAWVGLVATAFLTGYAKYSTFSKLIEPNRDIWTAEERAKRLGPEQGN